MRSPNKLTFAVRDEIGKVSGEVLKQYLAIPPEKRHELEMQGVTLPSMFANKLTPLLENSRVGSLLVLMEEGIGNMIMLTPVLRNLKHSHPRLKITVWCKDPAAEVIRDWDCVDNVITEFDHNYYDLVYVTIWGTQLAKQYAHLLNQYTKSTISSNFKTFHETLQHMGINDFLDANGEFSAPHCQTAADTGEWVKFIQKLRDVKLYRDPVQELGSVDEGGYKKYIVFGDTALRLATGSWDVKRWPHYQELAKLIQKKYPEYKIVMIGDKEDLAEAKEKEWPKNVTLDLMGELSIPELASLMKTCSLYIGNDTGPTHVAAAVGAKTYAIFAPTMVAKNRPLGKDVTILNKRMPCSPCQYTEKFETCECMAYLSANEVYNAVFHADKSTPKPKLMLVGDFSGGAHRNEYYIRKRLEKSFGHKVIPYDYRVKEKQFGNKVEATYDLLNQIVHHEPDIVLICGGQTIVPDILVAANTLSPKTKIVNWYVDNRQQVEEWFYRLSNACHASYWSTGDPKMLSEVFSQTQRPVRFLPIVPDAGTFKPMETNKSSDCPEVSKDIDVLFVGTPHSEPRIELLKFLAEKGVKLEIYGNGEWPEELKPFVKPGIFNEELVKVIHRSKIVLGINIVNNVPLYFSDRYFMPMACQVTGLNQYVPKLEDMFVDHEHMVFFRDHEDCYKQIQSLLADDNKRAKIGLAGLKLYLERYTLEKVLGDMLEDLKE